MKTICFVHCVDETIAQTQMFGISYMPVWAYTLASYLRDIPNIEINLFDNRVMSISEFPNADIYLFTGINQDFSVILSLLLKVKNQKSKYVIGGPICWSYFQAGQIEKLSDFDHIVIGDGEPIIRDLITNLLENKPVNKILTWDSKFEVKQSILMDRKLLDDTIKNYYGAVIEVSRGCPFLCEFCDIRIQKDNNHPHNLPPSKIIQEIDYFAQKGVNQILFACDNFIGDPIWAESVCDEIINWKKKTGLKISLYTWLTINLSNYNHLLKKLKLAGFDMFFIGIESFDSNQLLETAKIQNVKAGLIDSIRKIQSYGFIVVAGLIFGFDTESDDVSDCTLDGIIKSGLISGEPSLLMALPGTPLYKRMKYSGRLRNGKLGLGGYKYQTNIKYLKPTEKIIQNFQYFVKKYNQGSFQYLRFKEFCKISGSELKKHPIKSGYINVFSLFKIAFKNKVGIKLFARRIIKLLSDKERFYYFTKALFLLIKLRFEGKNLTRCFNFWLFVWSNSVIKFSTLKPSDFDIGSIEKDFDFSKLIPKEYNLIYDEPIPEHKMKAQRKYTTEALAKISIPK